MRYTTMKANHTWRFFRAGGFDQVEIQTGTDMLALEQLDKKLWTALACPVAGNHFDRRTLTLIDSDNDGRVRAEELLAAIRWTGSRLKNPDDMAKRVSPLPLSSINDATPEGKQLVESARQILASLGKGDSQAIAVEDTIDTTKILTQTSFNGDGIIVEESASDPTVKALIRDIMACVGQQTDRSGKPGISEALIEKFFAELAAYSEWHSALEKNPLIRPLNGGTNAAAAVFAAVKPKIEDYFARCRLAAFDSRSLSALNREEKEYVALAAKDLPSSLPDLAVFPLAQVAPNKPLPLKEGINPAWAGVISQFAEQVASPIISGASLSEEQWAAVKAHFAPYEAWSSAKAGGSVENLGLPRVRQILGSKYKESLLELIAKDKAQAGNVAAICDVEKLTRFTRDLRLLCTNFVSFKDFYDGDEPAMFQAGTLYLDQRSCELTMPVEDPGKHATMAGLAGAFLAYCDCTRKSTGEKMSIVAVFSQGDDDNLMVGRNGVFYDRNGKDWDATITKLITNPISLRQAFWMPYKKLVRMIEEQVAKRASAAEAASTQKLQSAAENTAQLDAKAVPPPAKKIDVGTVAALGVAFGAIGTFFAAIATGFVKLTAFGPLAIIAAIAAVMLLISTPSMILAYLKLRKRNLGPIMDANGWAVNAKAKFSVPFGATLTKLPKLPPGSKREAFDPYAEKKSRWPWLVAAALILYLVYGALDRRGFVYNWTNGWIGKQPAAASLTDSAKAAEAAAVSAAHSADAAAKAQGAP